GPIGIPKMPITINKSLIYIGVALKRPEPCSGLFFTQITVKKINRTITIRKELSTFVIWA
ncbi:hypothetical protein, partial [Spirosoma flavum]